jgi:hypothetical protein
MQQFTELQKGAFQPYQKKLMMEPSMILPTPTTMHGLSDQQVPQVPLDNKNSISLNIIEGFINSPQDKQNGGRDNKVPLRRHVVSVTLPQINTSS